MATKSKGIDTLAEALTSGQGIERPFRCFKHDDTYASASVNIVKGVWHCYGCLQSGKVEGQGIPSVGALEAMLTPEQAVRTYPASFMDLYSRPHYWLSRLPPWVCYALELGEDPFTGDATFPVHTPNGVLAGVGRRAQHPGDGPRYRYPSHWSASRTLFGSGGQYPTYQVLCLVEGAADAAAVWEVGCPALAVYGAGLHRPQLELLARYNPKLVLLGFDMDAAGDRASMMTHPQLIPLVKSTRVMWPAKDPGECEPQDRRSALVTTMLDVGASRYVDTSVARWSANVASMTDFYDSYIQEEKDHG